MLDHLSVSVINMDCSRQFYESTLIPPGSRLIKYFNHVISFGVLDGYVKFRDPGGEFWIYQGKALSCLVTHLALSAETRDVVDTFYHAAFVHDPDGYNIKAIFYRSIAS